MRLHLTRPPWAKAGSVFNASLQVNRGRSTDNDPMSTPNDRSKAIAHHVAVMMHHDTGHESFKLSAHNFAELWEDLVPENGQANSIQGEILRAIGVLAGEERRNGCVNWDRYFKDYEDLIEFLRTWLPNERVFNGKYSTNRGIRCNSKRCTVLRSEK
jgi:hypothetical protein